MIPKWSSDERVPEVSDREATIVEDTRSKRSFISAMFSRGSRSSSRQEADFIADVAEPMAEEIEELDEEIEELEERREGLLTRFFGFFFGRGSQSEDIEEDISQEQINAAISGGTSDEQTRAALKITHKWISRLPPEHLASFRESPDFEEYKTCLRNHGLIK